MEKKEVYSYKPSQDYREFTTSDPIKAQSEFNQNAERFYHADEFNQKADFKTSRFKLKKSARTTETNIAEKAVQVLQAAIKPVVIALTITSVVIIPTVIEDTHKHVSSEWIVDVAPTCTQIGSMHTECLECGQILKTQEIPMTEHQFTDGFVVEVEPTCTEDGYEVIKCTVCGFEKERQVLEKTGHVPSEVIIDSEASCTEDGHQHIVCTVCGAILSEETTPASGHKFGSWKTTRTATCLRTGIKERTCSNCGEKETQTIPKAKHYFIINQGIDSDFLIICRYCHRPPDDFGFLLDEGSEGYMILNPDMSLYQMIPY